MFGFLGGIPLAAMRLSPNPVLSTVSWAYIWVFRSVPLLVQLLFWANLGYLYDSLQIGIPFGPGVSFPTVSLISSFGAALLGLAMHEAAFAGEIIRAGLLSVDHGQHEAAAALGIPKWRQFYRIVLPQAMRAILPNAANLLVNLLKSTSIVYILAIGERFYQVQVIYGRNGRIVPLLMVATVWYVILTALLSILQYYTERHFARGAVRNLPAHPVPATQGGDRPMIEITEVHKSFGRPRCSTTPGTNAPGPSCPRSWSDTRLFRRNRSSSCVHNGLWLSPR